MAKSKRDAPLRSRLAGRDWIPAFAGMTEMATVDPRRGVQRGGAPLAGVEGDVPLPSKCPKGYLEPPSGGLVVSPDRPGYEMRRKALPIAPCEPVTRTV